MGYIVIAFVYLEYKQISSRKSNPFFQAIPCLTRSMFFKLFLKTLKFEFVLKGSGAEFHNFSAK